MGKKGEDTVIAQTGKPRLMTPATPSPAPTPRRTNGIKASLANQRAKIHEARARRRLTKAEADERLAIIDRLNTELDETLDRFNQAKDEAARSLAEADFATIETLVNRSYEELKTELDQLTGVVGEHSVKLASHDQQLEGVRNDVQKLQRVTRRLQEHAGFRVSPWTVVLALVVGGVGAFWSYNVSPEPRQAIIIGVSVTLIAFATMLFFAKPVQPAVVHQTAQAEPPADVERHPSRPTPAATGDPAALSGASSGRQSDDRT